ncbi:MAG: PDDEXK nuclease domain-containing protein [archaeon]
MNDKLSNNKMYASIKNIIEEARHNVYRQINDIMVKAYWEIGRNIVEEEQKGQERAEYGKSLLKELSSHLTLEFGKGFSVDNLQYMRKFYLCFPKYETVSRKLSWSHYCLLLRIDNSLSRSFYLIEAEKENWSVRELDREINSLLYERLTFSKDKEEVKRLSTNGLILKKPNDLIKDPFVLEFLGMKELPTYTENILEQKIIENLKNFILELGKGFMFVDRQKRITLENEHFYIDLVFYNRILRCFVIIELKIGRLTHKDMGQLQMYVNYFDREVKNKDENNTVGILLCSDKNDAVVKYTLPDNNNQIFASKYKLYLPTEEELMAEIKKEKEIFEKESKI